MSLYLERLAVLRKELDEYIYDFEAYASGDERDEEDEEEEEEDEMMYDDEDDEENEDGEEEDDNEEEEEEEMDDDENEEDDTAEDRQSENENMSSEQESESENDEPSSSKKQTKTKPKPETLVSLLARITSVVREATLDESFTDTDTTDLVAEVDRTFRKALAFAYESYGPYSEDYVPSFAHDDDDLSSAQGGKKRAPLLKDSTQHDGEEYQFAGSFLPHMESFLRIFGNMVDPDKVKEFVTQRIPPGWKTTFRPHPLSSPCARFRDENADIDFATAWGLDPETDVASTHPLATAVSQARVEIISTDTPFPDDMLLSRPSGDTLVLTSSGGYKNRVPFASFYHPNDAANNNDDDGMRARKIRLDLTSHTRAMAIHEPATGGGEADTLVFVGDWERVKSYRCGEGTNRRVHTLASDGYDGPLAILPPSPSGGQGERVVRCGKDGKVAVWELSTLPVHSVDASGAQTIIGTRIAKDDFNTWRDDPEQIEPSSGSLPTSFIQLDLGEHAKAKTCSNSWIGVWHPHPNRPATMLAGGGMDRENNDKYFCHTFDLERGGGPVVRYLGHGGVVEGFSTSVGSGVNSADGDPHAFLTWASDGHVRLYDTRVLLPVLTIAALPGTQLSPVTGAALAHPSGLPFIFTSAAQTECIKVWDVRAQRSCYELATGNNEVSGLVWDGRTGTLFASTECEHVQRGVPGGGYRVAKIPKVKVYAADAAHGDGGGGSHGHDSHNNREAEWEDEGEEQEEYDPPDRYKCWPKRAIHPENYFGHVFDAGRHRIFQYKFKLDPDGTLLPPYGTATTGGGGGDGGFGYW